MGWRLLEANNTVAGVAMQGDIGLGETGVGIDESG